MNLEQQILEMFAIANINRGRLTIGQRLGITDRTVYNRRKNPLTIRLDELIRLADIAGYTIKLERKA